MKQLKEKEFSVTIAGVIMPTSYTARLFGTQRHYAFENGYGASVIPETEMTGLASDDENLNELGVMIRCEDGKYHLCYDTPITNDVERYRTEDEIQWLLRSIKSLPPSQLACAELAEELLKEIGDNVAAEQRASKRL